MCSLELTHKPEASRVDNSRFKHFKSCALHPLSNSPAINRQGKPITGIQESQQCHAKLFCGENHDFPLHFSCRIIKILTEAFPISCLGKLTKALTFRVKWVTADHSIIHLLGSLVRITADFTPDGYLSWHRS